MDLEEAIVVISIGAIISAVVGSLVVYPLALHASVFERTITVKENG